MFVLKAIYFGKKVKDNYALQIRTLVTKAREQLGAVPIVFGETGVPMDLKWVYSRLPGCKRGVIEC